MIDDESFNNFDFYLKGVVNERNYLQRAYQDYNTLLEQVKELSWRQILVDRIANCGNQRSYSVGLPENLKSRFLEIFDHKNELKHLQNILEENYSLDEEESVYCTVQVNNLDQRIDISGGGLYKQLRGLGLGWKTYRALLEHEPYLSSRNHELYDYGRLLWNSIRRRQDFYSFYNKNNGFCFASDKDSLEIIEILEKMMKSQSEMLWDTDFVSQNKALILRSSISHLLP